ncbi:hypothetical protein M440DRAFT_20694 [Trichoderma longibrachiatum ATCC 18648]|uniref:Uncharacterized protein n=1 Tax=Trichoderma longibrachiatum ATCC 18648 TaxID=983965 RepID=A0A2T4BZ95_TRILO|nr:hypothetical protein M440DRAFT_20694 [Trichoderma longibrachiatum ATCC 18648]
MRSESEVTVSPVAVPPRTSSRRLLRSQPHSRVNSQSQQFQAQVHQPSSSPAQRHSFTLTRGLASSLPRPEAPAAAAATSTVDAEPLIIELESEAQWLAPRSKLAQPVQVVQPPVADMSKRPLYPQPPPRRSSKRIHYGDVDLGLTHDMQHQVNPSAPPSVDRFAHEDFDFRRRGTWTDDKERIVRGPFDEYSHNKGMCEDLTEGKFSFPVIHSIRADPVDLQLINILKQKTTDVQVKRYAVSYMDSKGSFEYTRQVVATLIERARKMVAELDDGSGRAAGIYKILDKMVISS